VHRKSAPGVRHDQDPLDTQQVNSQHHGVECGIGDVAAGIAEDLRIARLEPNILSGSMRESMQVTTATPLCDPVEPGEVEGLGKAGVGRKKVREVRVHSPRLERRFGTCSPSATHH